jgi:hypothetical protein
MNVVTQRYDIMRSGVYSRETTLMPSNVNSDQFGKLFSYPVDGYVYAQPLYLMGVDIPGAGTHNVLFVATEHDSVYAFDADNPGATPSPLWHISLLDAAHGAAPNATTVPSTDLNETDIVPEVGITSTPVIDPATGTLYVVGVSKENGAYVHRLHALDVTTGFEKAASPVQISASVPGTGGNSSGGQVSLDSKWNLQRAGLLLLNGIVYVGYTGYQYSGIDYVGWILGYNASTLAQTGVFCTAPNGVDSSVWMAGVGLAADVQDPQNSPYGRMFVATADGTFDATPPYSEGMDFGDCILRLDLTGGVPTIEDSFTPFNQQSLATSDRDLGSGGVLILPDQSSTPAHLLVQAGKEGRIYLANRDNLGGYNSDSDAVVQEIPLAPATTGYVVNPIFGLPTYWNGNLYFWGSFGDTLKQFSFQNGVMASSPSAQSAEQSTFPAPMPVISANGNVNGIVWSIDPGAYASQGPAVLRAHDATNVDTLLYASDQNSSRDNPGGAVQFTVPVIDSGKVYVGAEYQVSVFGLLDQEVATPSFSPPGGTYSGSQWVAISDATSGASVFYTIDGSAPTTSSRRYNWPIFVSRTTTLRAMATSAGMINSHVASATYTFSGRLQRPISAGRAAPLVLHERVPISDATPGASIYYTADGSTPTISAKPWRRPIEVVTTTLRAIAGAPGFSTSRVAGATYTCRGCSKLPGEVGRLDVPWPVSPQGFLSTTGI